VIQILSLELNFLLTIFSIIVAESIPFFDSLTGLVGALLAPISSWILPIYFFILVKQPTKQISILEWIILILIACLGIILTIFGTYSNILDIVDHWNQYGYPFSCSCQEMWNTCECSPDHTGMNCSL